MTRLGYEWQPCAISHSKFLRMCRNSWLEFPRDQLWRSGPLRPPCSWPLPRTAPQHVSAREPHVRLAIVHKSTILALRDACRVVVDVAYPPTVRCGKEPARPHAYRRRSGVPCYSSKVGRSRVD